MDIKRELCDLLNLDYYSDNEKDVVISFARTVSKDKNPNSIKVAYNDYYSFRRNSRNFCNKTASDIIDKIYKEKSKTQ
jgi:hypothetical protein